MLNLCNSVYFFIGFGEFGLKLFGFMFVSPYFLDVMPLYLIHAAFVGFSSVL